MITSWPKSWFPRIYITNRDHIVIQIVIHTLEYKKIKIKPWPGPADIANFVTESWFPTLSWSRRDPENLPSWPGWLPNGEFHTKSWLQPWPRSWWACFWFLVLGTFRDHDHDHEKALCKSVRITIFAYKPQHNHDFSVTIMWESRRDHDSLITITWESRCDHDFLTMITWESRRDHDFCIC